MVQVASLILSVRDEPPSPAAAAGDTSSSFKIMDLTRQIKWDAVLFKKNDKFVSSINEEKEEEPVIRCTEKKVETQPSTEQDPPSGMK